MHVVSVERYPCELLQIAMVIGLGRRSLLVRSLNLV